MEEADFELNLKTAKDLKTALRTQPLRLAGWVGDKKWEGLVYG